MRAAWDEPRCPAPDSRRPPRHTSRCPAPPRHAGSRTARAGRLRCRRSRPGTTPSRAARPGRRRCRRRRTSGRAPSARAHLVPVDQPELPGVVDQHVPGVEVSVAEDGRQPEPLDPRAELFRPVDEGGISSDGGRQKSATWPAAPPPTTATASTARSTRRTTSRLGRGPCASPSAAPGGSGGRTTRGDEDLPAERDPVPSRRPARPRAALDGTDRR